MQLQNAFFVVDKSKWTIYHRENYIIWLQTLQCPLTMGINMGQWEAHMYINFHFGSYIKALFGWGMKKWNDKNILVFFFFWEEK